MLKTINGGKLPTKGTRHSAAVDLYANANVTIYPGESVLVPLGVCIDLQSFKQNTMFYCEAFTEEPEFHPKLLDDFLESHYLQLMLRSSISKHLIIGNGVGIIDLDFTQEIQIRLHNPIRERSELDRPYTISMGDRIAQITLLQHKTNLLGIYSDTERIGGFGSTND